MSTKSIGMRSLRNSYYHRTSQKSNFHFPQISPKHGGDKYKNEPSLSSMQSLRQFNL